MRIRLVTLLLAACSVAPALAAQPEPLATWRYGGATLECYSPFWVSLHHVIWAHAFLEVDADEPPAWTVPAELTETLEWGAAVDWYRANLEGRDFGRDRMMRDLDLQLLAVDDGEPTAVDSDDQLLAHLNAVGPLYREHGWVDHNARAHGEIKGLEQIMANFGDAMGVRLAETYQQAWPQEPIIVLFLPYSNWAGAYTTFPPCIRISPDERLGDEVGRFETLWHEAAHLLEGLDGTLRTRFNNAASEQGLEPYRGLWHATLFFNCGVLVKEIGAADEEYVPYAFRESLYRGGWGPYREPIAKHWPRYLSGELTLDETVSRIVRDVPREDGE